MTQINTFFYSLIGIHTMQGLTAAISPEVTRKRSIKRLKHACRKSLYKEPQVNRYLLILDLKPLRL